jgi:hypothetical protein
MAKKPEEWESRLGTTSFNPLEVFDLQDAVKSQQPTADLQGRVFLLSYSVRNNEEVVYYRPERGFAPCGYLNVRRFLGGL